MKPVLEWSLIGLNSPGSEPLGTAPSGKTHHEGRKEERVEQTDSGQTGKRETDFPDFKREKIFLEIAAFALRAEG